MATQSTESLDSKLNFQGVHIELTEAMRTRVHDRLAGVLRHNADIVRINIRLHHDQATSAGAHYTATAQVEIGGPDAIASAAGTDAYAVLEELAEKLSRQLERRHDRLKQPRTSPGALTKGG
jgi:putative sigma-54 modulation protein